MAEESSPTPPASKSKQERIRDNQRRSRARRQEYLTDLERRLSECHISCREADLQRETFSQLQLENTRLRELLVYAGVNPDLVESYVSQDSVSPSQDASSSLRQIKPKMSASETAKPTSSGTGNNCGPRGCAPGKSTTGQQLPTAPIAAPTQLLEMSGTVPATENFLGYTPTTGSMTTSPSLATYTQHAVPMQGTNFDWLFQQVSPDIPPNVPAAHSPPSPSFHCNPFQMTVYSPSQPASSNTVLCSVAKDIIDRYGVTPDEMEEIKMRLYPHFSRPAYPGQDCHVDQQVLFEVLNELSAKHT